MSPADDPAVVAAFVGYTVHPLTLTEQEALLSLILRAIVFVARRIDPCGSITGLLQTRPLLEGDSSSARSRARSADVPLGPVALFLTELIEIGEDSTALQLTEVEDTLEKLPISEDDNSANKIRRLDCISGGRVALCRNNRSRRLNGSCF